MNIAEIKYSGWNIYYLNEKDKILGKSVVDNRYITTRILKDTKRNYVAVIEIEDKKYILKEFRSEIIIPQRKILTFFKKGEALTTLSNGVEAINSGLNELVTPLVAIVKKGATIQKSFLVMEYIEGEILKNNEDILEVIKLTKKIHTLKRYHGDLNTSNFLKCEDNLRILDTQMKSEKVWEFKRSYDLLTLKEDLLVQALEIDIFKNYGDIKKGVGFYLALFIKSIKKTKFINYFRDKKKNFREKGWKI